MSHQLSSNLLQEVFLYLDVEDIPSFYTVCPLPSSFNSTKVLKKVMYNLPSSHVFAIEDLSTTEIPLEKILSFVLTKYNLLLNLELLQTVIQRYFNYQDVYCLLILGKSDDKNKQQLKDQVRMEFEGMMRFSDDDIQIIRYLYPTLMRPMKEEEKLGNVLHVFRSYNILRLNGELCLSIVPRPYSTRCDGLIERSPQREKLIPLHISETLDDLLQLNELNIPLFKMLWKCYNISSPQLNQKLKLVLKTYPTYPDNPKSPLILTKFLPQYFRLLYMSEHDLPMFRQAGWIPILLDKEYLMYEEQILFVSIYPGQMEALPTSIH